MNEVAEGMVE